MSLIVAEHLYKDYPMAGRRVEVLRDASATFDAGELVALLGKSGSGKSTFLHLVGTLDRPTSGKIFFGNRDLTAMTSKQLSEFRNRHLGFVFQFHHLLPEFSAVENVMMPAWIGNSSAGAAERKRAVGLLERLELGHRVEHKPAQLSGGEQQRVAIARAMMNRPALILADEPTGNLDEQTSRPMLELIRELNRTEEVGFVIATHDAELAERADRVLRLYEGQLHEETRDKRPNDMLNSPETSASALSQDA